MEQRIPPQNVEAEQAVLGAMLLSHDAVIVAMEKLQPRDFYRDAHRIIFEAMEHLHRENKEIDVITLPEELNRMKKMDDVGGVGYVLNLPNMVGTASNAEYYANIVVEKALSRNLISTCTELATEAYDGEKKRKTSWTMPNGVSFSYRIRRTAAILLPSGPSSKRPSIKSPSSMKIKRA